MTGRRATAPLVRIALAVIVALTVILCATVQPRVLPAAPAAEQQTPLTGEELWWSLPAELLSDVVEGKMEAIASYQSTIRRLEAELERVQEIQKIKMAEARPPPG